MIFYLLMKNMKINNKEPLWNSIKYFWSRLKVKLYYSSNPMLHPFRFYHRGKYGWADFDLMGFDHYLEEILSIALPRLQKYKMGHPCLGETPPESCKTCSCEKEFDADLNRMSELFSYLCKDNFYSTKEKWWEEEKVYKEAMELLVKNWRGLWT